MTEDTPPRDGSRMDEQMLRAPGAQVAKTGDQLRESPLPGGPVPVPPDQLSMIEVYEQDVLRELFRAVHPGGEVPTPEQMQFLTDVVAGSRLLREHGAAIEATLKQRSRGTPGTGDRAAASPHPGEGGQALPGSASDVNLLVASIIDGLSQPAVIHFAREELAATVRRLEGEGASREAVADTVVRVLRALEDRAAIARTARHLLGYVHAERGDTLDYFLTVAMIGDLLSLGGAREDELSSGVAYHLAVRGVWSLAWGRDPVDLSDRERRFVATNVHNLVATIWNLVDRDAGATESTGAELGHPRIRRVVRVLQSVSAVVAPAPGANAAWVGRCLAALGADPGLRTEDRARETACILGRLGDSGRTWTDDPRIAAWIPAVSAVAAPIVGDPEFMASRLFNAGVSLLRLPDRSGEEAVRARLTLNLLGLRWALRSAEDRGLDVVGDNEALSCAVNFAGAVVDAAERDRWDTTREPLHQLVRYLLGGVDALGSDDARVRRDRARLAGSARRLGLRPLAPASPAQLFAALDGALAAVRDVGDREPAPGESALPEPDREQHLILDTAEAVGSTFAVLGIEGPWAEITDLVEARRDPAGYFADRYREFVPPGEEHGAPGTGPFRDLGLVTEAEWEELRTELLRDPGSLYDALRGL